jgi:hypothetical protein
MYRHATCTGKLYSSAVELSSLVNVTKQENDDHDDEISNRRYLIIKVQL